MATKLDDFSAFAQRVWAEPTVVGKQAIVLEMIDACHSKPEKKQYFRVELGRMNNPARIDRFATDLMLVDTDKRIR